QPDRHSSPTRRSSDLAQTLGQQRLSHANRSNENAVLLTRQELQCEHVLELASIELDWRGPVKAVQRHAVLEASLHKMPFERLLRSEEHTSELQSREKL